MCVCEGEGGGVNHKRTYILSEEFFLSWQFKNADVRQIAFPSVKYNVGICNSVTKPLKTQWLLLRTTRFDIKYYAFFSILYFCVPCASQEKQRLFPCTAGTDWSFHWKYWPFPLAAPSKAWVCFLSLAGITDSNPAGGMNVCLLRVLCVAR